jgi:hypothetical protein
MRLGAGRKRGNFLMADVDRLDFIRAADHIGDAIQTVANDPVDALNVSRCERPGKLIRDGFHKAILLLVSIQLS